MSSSENGRSIPDPTKPPAVIDVPDIRDYHRINAELVQLLDQGVGHVRLTGAEDQRLLLSGVKGAWSALIEIEGNSGPELCAGLDAPGLRVVCRGRAADGVGSGLVDGRILILGDVGACAGVSQRGGFIVVAGESTERAGLNQVGGTLCLFGHVGALTGERQRGGTLIFSARYLENHRPRGGRGGRVIPLGERIDDHDRMVVEDVLGPFRPWLGPDRLAGTPFAELLARPEIGR